MLNSEDSKRYRNAIEQVYPGFFKRVLDYDKSVQNTHALLGADFIKILKNPPIYENKIDEKMAYNLAYTFLKRINPNEADLFANLVKNNEIKMVDRNAGVGGNAKYDETTKKSTVLINRTGTLMDSAVVLHEFMHLKTNGFSGASLREKAENRKYQEELSIFIELSFAKFLKNSKYEKDSKQIYNYRIRTALLSSPGQMQTILTALYYADQNRPQEAFVTRFGQFLNKCEFQIKHFIPMDIEDYYLGTMSAINNLDNSNEKLKQIFELLKIGDFEEVKRLFPISYNPTRDSKNIRNLYE